MQQPSEPLNGAAATKVNHKPLLSSLSGDCEWPLPAATGVCSAKWPQHHTQCLNAWPAGAWGCTPSHPPSRVCLRFYLNLLPYRGKMNILLALMHDLAKKVFGFFFFLSGNSALFCKSLGEKTHLTASKLDHRFPGWWQRLRIHPEGKDLNKLRFTITDPGTQAAFPLMAEEGSCMKRGGFGEPGGMAAPGKAQLRAVVGSLLCMGGRQSAALNTCHQFNEI